MLAVPFAASAVDAFLIGDIAKAQIISGEITQVM